MPPLESDEQVDDKPVRQKPHPDIEVIEHVKVLRKGAGEGVATLAPGDQPAEDAAARRRGELSDAYWSGVRAGRDQIADGQRREAAAAISRAWRIGAAAVTAALVLGAGAGHLSASKQSEAAPGAQERVVTQTSIVQRMSPECRSALNRAAASLTIATRVEGALADHSRVMNQLYKSAITPEQAMQMGREPLVRGSEESAKLDGALAEYLTAMKNCDISGS